MDHDLHSWDFFCLDPSGIKPFEGPKVSPVTHGSPGNSCEKNDGNSIGPPAKKKNKK